MNDQIRVHVVDYGRASLYMRFVDPVTGKQVTRSTGTKRKREAERIAAKWEAELHSGAYKPPSRMTWDEFWERYDSECLSGLAETTAKKSLCVRSVCENFGKPERIASIDERWLSEFAAWMRGNKLSENTIDGYLAHLQAALRWAAKMGYRAAPPKVDKPTRARSQRGKGRALTTEEFERMLAATPKVVGDADAASWRSFLKGLWWSGLRLGESLSLHWDRDGRIRPILNGQESMLLIPAELEKGNRDRLLPMAPEFTEFLSAVPKSERRGRVFHLRQRCHGTGQLTKDRICRQVGEIGKRANVAVWTHPKTSKVKYASPHDLRRSFGFRWAERVMPAVLQEMMRHESIDTTMQFYVGRNAKRTAATIWNAYDGSGGNTLGNSALETVEIPAES